MASVVLQNIGKKYDNGFEAVIDLNLEIADGEFLVLVGPSGCGKTTALRMVAGLEDITGGELRIGDRRVNEVAPKDRDIAMVFQSYALYPHMTVAENIGFGLKLRKMPKEEINRRVQEAAKMLALEENLDRRPKQLSGGQRQRVAIARALVNHPSILLADEPTGALDTHTSYEIMELFERLHEEGNTIILVTHEHDIAERAHRIITIRDGEIEKDEKIK